MIKNGYRYIRQLIDIDMFLNDTGNQYLMVSQRPDKGKMNEEGVIIRPAGVKMKLQILKDMSKPLVDKETGEIKEDNVYETFDVTIVGATYPLPIKKGSIVALKDFLPEYSYYIEYNFILRFGSIEEVIEDE